MSEVTKKSEKVTTPEARCGSSGGTPHMYFLGKWKYVPFKTRVYIHYAYWQCHIVMSITLQCIATLYMSAIAELWDILPRPDNTVHSYWLQTGSLSSVCGLSPQYRVFKCSAKLGGDCTQPGGPVSPITQHWRIKVSTKFPCIFHNIWRMILILMTSSCWHSHFLRFKNCC